MSQINILNLRGLIQLVQLMIYKLTYGSFLVYAIIISINYNFYAQTTVDLLLSKGSKYYQELPKRNLTWCSATATNGATPCGYWADVEGTVNAQEKTDLIGGTYVVVVTDASSCKVKILATLNAQNALPNPSSGLNN